MKKLILIILFFWVSFFPSLASADYCESDVSGEVCSKLVEAANAIGKTYGAYWVKSFPEDADDIDLICDTFYVIGTEKDRQWIFVYALLFVHEALSDHPDIALTENLDAVIYIIDLVTDTDFAGKVEVSLDLVLAGAIVEGFREGAASQATLVGGKK